MTGASRTVEGIFDAVCEAAEHRDKVSVQDIVQAIGYRGYGPFLLVPALLEISPLGAIPAMPTILATIITIFAVQIALGRRHLWLPHVLEDQAISAARLDEAAKAMGSAARWLDRWFHFRLPVLAGPLATRIAAACCILLCITVPPLEFVPFASTAPMAAIAVFGLAMTVRDGALMLAGFLLTVAAFTVGVFAGT